MSLSKNNLLFYYDDLSTIGSAATLSTAVAIVSKYDAIILKPHVSQALTDLKTILYEVRKIKPAFKVFGYTDLTGANLTPWNTAVNSWITDLATSLSGIYIDNFGFDNGLTRDQQITAVAFCHGKTAPLSVFAQANNTVDILGVLAAEATPTIGRDDTIVDYIMMTNFFYANTNASTPTLEAKEDLIGRCQYLNSDIVDRTVTPVRYYNLLRAVSIGGGNAGGITLDAYNAMLTTVNKYGIEYLSVNPFDYGATSNKYFYQYRPNTFADA